MNHTHAEWLLATAPWSTQLCQRLTVASRSE